MCCAPGRNIPDSDRHNHSKRLPTSKQLPSPRPIAPPCGEALSPTGFWNRLRDSKSLISFGIGFAIQKALSLKKPYLFTFGELSCRRYYLA